jgi:hypothetical protein
MYKLTVVAGPSRGQSFAVQEGETSIGRQAGNAVVLTSAKVSKKHCVLVVSDGQVIVTDQGSSNGTFVNGVLAKSKPIHPGDRISVGEYVLELTRRPEEAPRAVPAIAGLGNVLQFPKPAGRAGQPSGGFPGMPGIPSPGMMAGEAPGVAGINSGAGVMAANQPPKDLKGKVIWAFEHHLMPFFYALNLKHEWRVICIGGAAAFTLGSVVLSVYPLIEHNREALVNEMGKRAWLMAKQVAERNAAAIAAGAVTKTEISPSIENADGVRVALLTDLDSRILAPANKLNQYLTGGAEAEFAVKARKAFRDGRETALVAECDGSTICAIEPVRIVSQQAGRNVTVAMAIVSIDSSLATPDLGEMGMTYAESLIAAGLLGGLVFLVLYRITLKPLRQLNEDMDQVLKGSLAQVTHEFKFEELDALWDLINSALQRVPKGTDALGGALGGGGPSAEELAGPLKMMGGVAQFPVLVCDGDKKVMFMNSMFEDVSGIRLDNALGQEISVVARDQSFAQFTNDLFDRAMPGTEGVSEDYDFSGVSYKCHASCVGSGSGKCYVLAATRVEG